MGEAAMGSGTACMLGGVGGGGGGGGGGDSACPRGPSHSRRGSDI